jgi:acetyl-CoA carboxylase beta subunit
LEHGFLDFIEDRRKMKQKIASFLSIVFPQNATLK